MIITLNETLFCLHLICSACIIESPAFQHGADTLQSLYHNLILRFE